MSIDLGFVEYNESSWLVNRYFPSKVGGKPAWLDLDRLPRTDELKCTNCGSPKVLLCQVYASFDTGETFHRTVYVFYCRSDKCQIPNNNCSVSVFRCQLPLRNKFYSTDPPKESGNALPALPTKENLCVSCGCLGPYACGACKKVHYCSKAHQKQHYRYHKASCKSDETDHVEPTNNSASVTFPELEIVIESFAVEETEPQTDPEDNEDEDKESIKDTESASKELEKEKEQLALLQEMKAAGKAGSLDDVSETELAKYASVEASVAVDKYFRTFKKVISKEPSQVIRYDRDGKPLWIANPSETIKDQLQIPKCENCGSARQFEFQVMPQMLNSLKDSKVDWGVLAIYTCQKSCSTNSTDIRYLKEYVIKQDILENNIKS